VNESVAFIPSKKKNNWIVAFVKMAATILIFALLFRQTSFRDLESKVREVDFDLLCICITMLFLLNLSVATRWRIVLRHFGAISKLTSLWRFTMIGAFFNQFLPSGMGGDIFRIWYAQESSVPLGKAVASVVVDRVLGFMGLFLFIAVGVPYILVTTQSEAARTPMFIMAALLLSSIAIFIRLDLLSRALYKFVFFRKWIGESDRMARLQHGAETCVANTRSLLRKWPDGLFVLIFSVINQTTLGLVVFILARALGDRLDLFAALFVFPFVLLLSMLPISLAGWGVRESAMVVVFALVGMPRDIALGVSILFGICQLLSALPGACLWLLRYPLLTKKIEN